jgi:hypothetical protein
LALRAGGEDQGRYVRILGYKNGQHTVEVEQRTVGRTTFERREIDAATVESQPALVADLTKGANSDLVLDVRLIGVRPDGLDIDTTEIEQSLKSAYLRVRVRDVSHPALTEGALPPEETIAGAFIRNVEGKIADLEASGDDMARREADELRDVLRLGRLLLNGSEVTL